jgi:hypothetical protein
MTCLSFICCSLAGLEILPVVLAGLEILPIVLAGLEILPVVLAGLEILPVVLAGLEILPVVLVFILSCSHWVRMGYYDARPITRGRCSGHRIC